MKNNIFLLERVAWLYHVTKKTQQEIANMLNISRSKVSRILQEAERKGIVESRVKLRNHQYYPEVELELTSLFQLHDCLVVPTLEEHRVDFFGDAAAQYIERIIEEGDILGVAWGWTLKEVFSRFKTGKDLSSVTIVQLLGGLSSEGPEMNIYDVTKYIPGAKYYYLYAPAIVSCPEARKYFMLEPQIQKVFEMMSKIDKAFLGVGDVGVEASLLKAGFVTAQQMNELVESGAVGDVVGRYFDLEGRPVKTEMDERIVGITLEQLRNIPLRVGLALGERKVKPLVGALRGGYINSLITDYATALGVIKTMKIIMKSA